MNFRQTVFMILGEGQELSGAEKVLAGEVVDSFINDYVVATKEKPLPFFGTIILIANRLQPLGFKMPRVDRWFEEDMPMLRRYAERQPHFLLFMEIVM